MFMAWFGLRTEGGTWIAIMVHGRHISARSVACNAESHLTNHACTPHRAPGECVSHAARGPLAARVGYARGARAGNISSTSALHATETVRVRSVSPAPPVAAL